MERLNQHQKYNLKKKLKVKMKIWGFKTMDKESRKYNLWPNLKKSAFEHLRWLDSFI